MDIFEWTEETAVTANNLNEMQNTLNENIKEYVDFAYSISEEKKTNEKWVNGKPIYTKTVYVNSLPNNAYVAYNHDIENIDISWIDMANTFIQWSNGDTAPFNYISVSQGTSVSYNSMIEIRGCGKTSFTISTGYDRRNLRAYVTIKYTKTTD